MCYHQHSRRAMRPTGCLEQCPSICIRRNFFADLVTALEKSNGLQSASRRTAQYLRVFWQPAIQPTRHGGRLLFTFARQRSVHVRLTGQCIKCMCMSPKQKVHVSFSAGIFSSTLSEHSNATAFAKDVCADSFHPFEVPMHLYCRRDKPPNIHR